MTDENDGSETERIRGTQADDAYAREVGAIGRLAGEVAHDFANLLTVITQCGEAALQRLGEEHAAREDVVQMTAAARRAADLTRRLLVLSRSHAAPLGLVTVNAVVADMKRMLRRVLGDDAVLSVALQPAAGAVRADSAEIEQILMNLTLNARDAIPPAGRVEITTADVDIDAAAAEQRGGMSPGRYVVLAVRDTGHGMDEATRARMFEPFFTTKAPGKGTGLGLATVYCTVQRLLGFVSVETAPGRGTAVRVYLPRATEDQAQGVAAGAVAGARADATVARAG